MTNIVRNVNRTVCISYEDPQKTLEYFCDKIFNFKDLDHLTDILTEQAVREVTTFKDHLEPQLVGTQCYYPVDGKFGINLLGFPPFLLQNCGEIVAESVTKSVEEGDEIINVESGKITITVVRGLV